jgi:hypothetical protein
MRRPSPSMLVALVALFVALTSSATAAVIITGKNVKDGSLTGKDLKKRSITADRLAANVLAGSARPGAAGPQGAVGATGSAGANGADGAAGAQGATGSQGATGLQGATGATGVKGDKGDPSYRRTIVVSPCTTQAGSGDALLAVVGAGTASECAPSGTIPATGANAPSATNPWLIKLEPGTYALGTTRLVLPDHVDLEGSGAQTSQIVATDGGLDVAGTSDVRQLGITGVGSTAPGVVHLLQTARATIDRSAITATLTTTGTSLTVVALNIDHSLSATVRDSILSTTAVNSQTTTIQSVGASPLITGSTATTTSSTNGSARAMRFSVGAPVVTGSIVSATNGNSAFPIVAGTSAPDTGATSVTVRDSTLAAGTGTALSANGAGATGTQTISAYDVRADGNATNNGVINLAGGIVGGVANASGGGVLRCVSSFRSDFTTALDADCS